MLLLARIKAVKSAAGNKLNWHLPAQSQQQKHQSKVQNTLKANNIGTRTTSMTFFQCPHFPAQAQPTPCTTSSTVEFE